MCRDLDEGQNLTPTVVQQYFLVFLIVIEWLW